MAVFLTQEAAGAYQTQKALRMTFSKYSFNTLRLNLIIEDSRMRLSKADFSMGPPDIKSLPSEGSLLR